MFNNLDFSKIQYLKLYLSDIPECNTDYIDYLEWEKIKYPVVWGTDHYGRKYITIKALIGKKKIMQTFFQRYTDTSNCWAFGDCYRKKETTCPLFISDGRLKSDTFKFIEELIKNEIIDLKDWYDKNINKLHWCVKEGNFKLKLYNYIKEKWIYLIKIKLLYNILSEKTNLNNDLCLKISKISINL
mgnify:CR=1 FL=1|tara:strand:- start:131 stop:688 length:558 start_codon:yes stop_codon:yes gene_type:complete